MLGGLDEGGVGIISAGERTTVRCNVAFVAEGSPLVARLRSEGEFFLEEGIDGDNSNGNGGSLPPLLRHGF